MIIEIGLADSVSVRRPHTESSPENPVARTARFTRDHLWESANRRSHDEKLVVMMNNFLLAGALMPCNAWQSFAPLKNSA
jgi:hypothetical protein